MRQNKLVQAYPRSSCRASEARRESDHLAVSSMCWCIALPSRNASSQAREAGAFFAVPKSAILMTPSLASSKLAHFRSRCAIPRACKYCTPHKTWRIYERIVGSSNGPKSFSSLKRIASEESQDVNGCISGRRGVWESGWCVYLLKEPVCTYSMKMCAVGPWRSICCRQGTRLFLSKDELFLYRATAAATRNTQQANRT